MLADFKARIFKDTVDIKILVYRVIQKSCDVTFIEFEKEVVQQRMSGLSDNGNANKPGEASLIWIVIACVNVKCNILHGSGNTRS